MAANRLLYTASLAAVVAFYLINGTWFSWILLLAVLLLPVLGLLCSLPAMLKLRITCTSLPSVEQLQEASFHIRAVCPEILPLPEFRVRLEIKQTGSGERTVRYLSKITRHDGVLTAPTPHAGLLCYTLVKGKVYDYLGIFCKRVKLPAIPATAVFPLKEMPKPLPDLSVFEAATFKPKAGGGVSEIHDHREYRDGDDVRAIQWKLSCKSDKVIIREPLEPVQRRVVLLLQTPADARELDSVLGQLRYLSEWLCERGYAHRVVYLRGQQPESFPVRTADDTIPMLLHACDLRCSSTPLPLPDSKTLQADWLYVIRPADKEGKA